MRSAGCRCTTRALEVEAGHLDELDLHVVGRVAATWRSGGAIWPGRQHARRHLVQQRLEQVVVAAVDQRDVDGQVAEEPGGGQPAEATSDDDDAVAWRLVRRDVPPRRSDLGALTAPGWSA